MLALDEDGQAGADINHMDLVMRADEGFAAPSDDESPGLANIAPRAVGQFDLVPAAFFADDPSCIAWTQAAKDRRRSCRAFANKDGARYAGRKSVVEGKRVSVRVECGGRRIPK